MAMLMREPVLRLRDNPILRGMARMRMGGKRLQGGAVSVVGVGAFGTLGAWATGAADAWDAWAGFLLFIMGALLCLRAPGAVAAQLSEERQTGILDFHRAAPMTPWSQAVGYLLGASSRDWVLAGLVLPFFLLAASVSDGAGGRMVLALPVILLSALVYQSAGMLLGLVGNPRQAGARSGTALVMVAWFIALSLGGTGVHAPMHLTPFPVLALVMGDEPALSAPVPFFGVPVPPLLFTLAMHAHALFFLLLAATRRLRRDDAPLLSRRHALLFVVTVDVLLLGGAWAGLHPDDGKVMGAHSMVALVMGIYLVSSVGLASFMAMALAPPYLAVARTLRRSRRAGLSEAGWLEDGGPMAGLVVALSGITLAGAAAVAAGASGTLLAAGEPSLAVCMVSAVALVSLCAFAAEYAQLSWRSSAWRGVLPWAFVVLVAPLLLSAVLAAAELGPAASIYAASLSPLFSAGTLMLGHALGTEADVAIWPPSMLSAAVTVVLAAVFFVRARALRAAIVSG